MHQLHAGIDVLKEYGNARFIDKAELIAYYQFDAKSIRFIMGSFPRRGLLDALPKAFFQDSISYYRPNLTGMWWQYRKAALDASLFLDWTGRKALNVHEAFFVGSLLTWRSSLIFAEWQTLMFHHAGSERVSGVHENVLNHVAVGLDLTHLTSLDTLSLHIGYLGGYERDRNRSLDWTIRHGWLAEMQAGYKGFGLKSSTYVGEGLMSDYALRGSSTYWGDPFFRGTFYNRTDVTYQFFNQGKLSLKLMASQHFSEGHCYFEQSLLAYIAIGKKTSK
jgi:hypothetical protein